METTRTHIIWHVHVTNLNDFRPFHKIEEFILQIEMDNLVEGS